MYTIYTKKNLEYNVAMKVIFTKWKKWIWIYPQKDIKIHENVSKNLTQIQNLEKLLNVKLFERTNKGLSLTEDGRTIFNNIKESIETLEGISNKYNSVRVINLGVHATLLNKLLSKRISEYYSINSNVKINIVNNDITQMLAKLEKKSRHCNI